MMKKIDQLEEKLQRKNENDEKLEYERLKRETKQAALGEVKMDELYAKLILLDNMARKVNDPHKEQISMLISRFQAHRTDSRFASALVVKLLSSKEEEIVLDKEQKMLKLFGNKREDSMQSVTGGLVQGGHCNSQVWPNYQFPQSPLAFQPRGVFGYQRPFRFRSRAPMKLSCFRCHAPGHMVKDCPQSQEKF